MDILHNKSFRLLLALLLVTAGIYCKKKPIPQAEPPAQQWYMPDELVMPVVKILKYPGDDTLRKPVLHGTGFLLYDYKSPADTLILVTNRHIFGEHARLMLSTITRNQAGFYAFTNVPIELKDNTGQKLWVGHPNPAHDIAAMKITLSNGPPNYMLTGYPKSFVDMSENFGEGAEVIFFGFPDLQEEIPEDLLKKPIARRGCVSLMGFMRGDHFLIEGFSYSGNSGSPVFRKIKRTDNKTKKEEEAYVLIGVISSHLIHYEDPVDPGTGQPLEKPLVTLDGKPAKLPLNSGLAVVEPLTRILETLKQLNGETGWETGK